MATVSNCSRKLKFWVWLLWTVLYLKQTGFLKDLISCIQRPTKKFSFTLISKIGLSTIFFLNQTILLRQVRLASPDASKDFLMAKVLPNSVLSLKSFTHAHWNMDITFAIFANSPFSNLYHFQMVTVLHRYLWTY